MIRERVPALGREADAETACRLGIEPALAEESAADLGVGCTESLDEELGGRLVGGEQPRAAAVVGRLAAVFVLQLVADAARQPLDRLSERDVVHALQERVDVAGLAASEAVVVAELRTHMEARTALVVEWAQALHRPDAGRLQAHVLADDVGDVRAGFHLIDVALSNPARHGSDPIPRCRSLAPRRRSPVTGRAVTGTAARTTPVQTGR